MVQKKKKGLKTFIIVFCVIAIIVIIILLNQPKNTEVPNVVGMTVEQVEKIANEANWDLVVEDVKGRYIQDKQAVVIAQRWKAGEKLSEDSIFFVYVQEDEDIENIETVIKEFANNTRNNNNGSVKYSNYTLYKRTASGEKIYKIKYTTSSDIMFYYQLVSLNTDNTKINKSTRLFNYIKYPNGVEDGEKLELEYAYKELWEN